MPRAKDAKGHKRSGSKAQSTPTSPSSPRPQKGEQIQYEVQPAPKDEEVSYVRIVVSVIKASVTLAVMPLVSIATQTAMQPLYASAPTMYQIRNLGLGAAVLSGALTAPGENSFFPSESDLSGLIGLLLLLAPTSYHWISVLTSRLGSALWGPIATHAILTVPTSLLMALLMRFYMTRASTRPPPFAMAAPLLGWNFVQGVEPVYWEKIKFGDPLNPTLLFTAIGTLFIANALLTPVPKKAGSPSDKLQTPSMRRTGYFAFIGVVAISLGVYGTFKMRRFPIGSSDGSHQLLASAYGRLGLVTVGENRSEGYRYLRAGHSLLGGLWIEEKAALPISDQNPMSQLMPARLGDSIYSAFVLQEGVRLFKAANTGGKGKALIIGLGAGVAARSMNEHGMELTIVEIDPLVYKYARQYFGLHRLQLPAEGSGSGVDGDLWIRDARAWVHETVMNGTSTKYDYIIHDVFSGGSVPGHIFTVEFWEEVKILLKEDGILAVNFAGILGTPSSRSILRTLLHVFSTGTCKAYHDDLELSTESEKHHHGKDDFFNMVFFCSSFPDLNPREAIRSDYLGSTLREHILSTLSEREVDKGAILGNENEMINGEVQDWILRDSKNRLPEWQTKTAMLHWKIMRDVLPSVVWETY